MHAGSVVWLVVRLAGTVARAQTRERENETTESRLGHCVQLIALLCCALVYLDWVVGSLRAFLGVFLVLVSAMLHIPRCLQITIKLMRARTSLVSPIELEISKRKAARRVLHFQTSRTELSRMSFFGSAVRFLGTAD